MTTDEDGACPVCLEALDGMVQAAFPCKHRTCLGCLVRIARPVRCPLCRLDLAPLLPPDWPPTPAPPSPPSPFGEAILMDPSGAGVQAGITSRSEALMFEVAAPDPGETPPTSVALIVRTVQPSDLLHARVTRNNIFIR